ncbi:MAG: hypothetical protein Hens3KO_11100 [Henriciella sp.]
MNVVPGHTDALSQWAPRRQLSLAQARERSQLVGFLRIGFVVAAAISAGIMIGPIAASSLGSGVDGPVRLAADEVVTMVNPRFTGRNVAGEAFVITADTARRRAADSSVIDLTNPHLVNESGTEITAPTGIYNQNAEYLDLYRAVEVNDGQGYTFKTTAARVFVQDGRVEGLEPLSGNGPLGDVRSDSYEIVDDGDRVILRGNVDMTIYPNEREPAVPDVLAPDQMDITEEE